MKLKNLKEAFKNYKYGKRLLVIKTNENEGVLFEREFGMVRYVGVMKRNKKGFKFDYTSINLILGGKSYLLSSNEVLPLELANYFFKIFETPTKEKSKLEEMIKEIKIIYKKE